MSNPPNYKIEKNCETCGCSMRLVHFRTQFCGECYKNRLREKGKESYTRHIKERNKKVRDRYNLLKGTEKFMQTLREANKRYRKRNSESISEKRRQRRIEDKEYRVRIKASEKKSYTREEACKRRIEYQRMVRNNPEGKLKLKEENKKRRFSKHIWWLRKKGRQIDDVTKRQIIQKLESIKCCVYCGSKEKLSVDHKIPLSKGGEDSKENMTISCKSCNSSKYNLNLEEWLLRKHILSETT